MVRGAEYAVKILLCAGADPYKANDDGTRPIDIIEKNFQPDQVEELIEIYESPLLQVLGNVFFAPNDLSASRLMKYLEITDSRGFLNKTTEYGENALGLMKNTMNCDWKYFREISLELIERGIDLKALNCDGNFTLVATYEEDQIEDTLKVWQAMLDKGFDFNVQNQSGRNVLQYAVCQQYPAPYIEWLIEHGADVNLSDNQGNNVWHNLVLHGFTLDSDHKAKMMEILYKAGANFNAPNKEGSTPLDLASSICIDDKYCNEEAVEWLAGHNAGTNCGWL